MALFPAGKILTAQMLNDAFGTTVSDTQSTAGTTTSTSYTATLTGGTTCGLTFVAPPSGKVIVHNTCEALNSGAGFTKCGVEVRTGSVIGSGTAVLTVSDDENFGTTGSASVRGTATFPMNGLTPGASYNIRQLFRVQSGTGTFLRKKLTVEPVA